MNSKPAHEIRIGAVKATVWPNEGKAGARYTVTTSRSFKAGEEWRQTSSYHKSDLPKLIAVLSEAEQWIAGRETAAAA